MPSLQTTPFCRLHARGDQAQDFTIRDDGSSLNPFGRNRDLRGCVTSGSFQEKCESFKNCLGIESPNFGYFDPRNRCTFCNNIGTCSMVTSRASAHIDQLSRLTRKLLRLLTRDVSDSDLRLMIRRVARYPALLVDSLNLTRLTESVSLCTDCEASYHRSCEQTIRAAAREFNGLCINLIYRINAYILKKNLKELLGDDLVQTMIDFEKLAGDFRI